MDIFGHYHKFEQKKWWQFWKKKKFNYLDGKNFLDIGSFVTLKDIYLKKLMKWKKGKAFKIIINE